MPLTPRVLPLLIVATALLFCTKVANVWFAFGTDPVATAHAQPAAETPRPSPAPAALAAAREPPSPAAKRGGRDPMSFSPQEVEILQSLSHRRDDLDKGDELVIAEWDRATRSMWDGLQIIKAVIDAGAAIRVLDRSYIDLATPMGRGFMAMMSAMAEDERLRIIKRTHEGRQIARAKGVRMVRKPKLTPHQIKEARQRLAKGEPTRALAKSYGVSVSTISRLAG